MIMKLLKVLIIDDDSICCDVLTDFINRLPGCSAIKTCSGMEGLSILINEQIDVVFSDVDMPGLNGIELTMQLKKYNIPSEIILISGNDEIIFSINSIELGVYDFLTKPVDIYKIKNIIQNIRTKTETNNLPVNVNLNKLKSFSENKIININDFIINFEFKDFIFFSTKMQNIYRKLQKLQEFQHVPVLLEGKTGVGKEVLAKQLHYQDLGKDAPFIGINCAAINKDIFEAELFGYEKGAFTGASATGRPGYFKASERGTLFLDEVSEIPLLLQAKLLRVLQEKEYYKVGGTKIENVNSRIILASNKNLRKLVKKGLFREDLFYRINVCKVIIPPLKERKEDIIPLAVLFINEINNRITKVEAGFFQKLLAYSWPGNIRELKNTIINAVIFNESEILKSNSLAINSRIRKKNIVLPTDDFYIPDVPFDLELFITKVVDKTLDKFNGNKSKTARFLNLSRIQLYKRYKTHK